jgi:hypothetical protein
MQMRLHYNATLISIAEFISWQKWVCYLAHILGHHAILHHGNHFPAWQQHAQHHCNQFSKFKQAHAQFKQDHAQFKQAHAQFKQAHAQALITKMRTISSNLLEASRLWFAKVSLISLSRLL